MKAGVLKRFTRVEVLRRIEGARLAAFLEGFREELAARGMEPPALVEGQASWIYHQAVERMLLAQEALPERLTEALLAIEEMSTPEGHEALVEAVGAGALAVRLGLDAPPEEFALAVWQAAPELLARVHAAQGLRRLRSFVHFRGAGSREAAAEPSAAALERLRASLDEWCVAKRYGQGTVHLERHEVDGEWFFVIRRGDALKRVMTTGSAGRQVRTYRPERDEAVAYSPARDAVRVSARTAAAREIYRRRFGLCLRGALDYFRGRDLYCLEPLREDLAGVLNPAGVAGLQRVVLRRLGLAWDDDDDRREYRKAADLARAAEKWGPLPNDAALVRAGFELRFAGDRRPCRVEVETPNVLRLTRSGYLRLTEQWLERCGIRLSQGRMQEDGIEGVVE